MGSISNDIFCKILRASDKVYATEEVITKKLTLADDAGREYDFNTKYYNSTRNSGENLTAGTEYDLGNVMTLAGVPGIPRQYEFYYEFTAPDPLTAGGSKDFYFKDDRSAGGIVDAGFNHAQTVWITNGTDAKWYEIQITINADSATQAHITFTNTGAADYTGAIRFTMTQTPVRQTT